MSQPSSDSVPARAPRFSWPLRVLLFLVLFHMIFRSTDILYPWEDWLYEFKLKRMPRGLPTREELARMSEEAGGSSEPAITEFQESAASLAPYWNPVPAQETRDLLTSKSAWVKYGLAWTASRLQWCECILAIDQEWAMFSPNVRKHNYATRARLRFEDGAEFTIRPRSEPEDLTSYSRWKQGKTLGIDRFVASDHGRRHEACLGYCNFLAHRYPSNSNGSPLRAIVLYEVHFKFVPAARPWSRDEPVDTQEFLRDQMERTRDSSCEQCLWAFYLYDPNDRTGEFMTKERRYPAAKLPEQFQSLPD